MLRYISYAFLSLAFMLGTSPAYAENTDSVAPEPASAPTVPIVAARTTSTTAPNAPSAARGVPASAADVAHYQTREAASPQAADYRGGLAIYVSAGAIILVLVIMILILVL